MLIQLYRALYVMLSLLGLLYTIAAIMFAAAGYDFKLVPPQIPIHISSLHGSHPTAMPPGPEADQISGTFYEVASDSFTE